MAISLKTAGAWVETNTDIVHSGIFDTAVAGDRIFIWAAWKDFSITASITAATGTWTEVGTAFADGSVGNGNGTGSVKVACWYIDYVGNETLPTIDFSSSPNQGASLYQVWQKASTDVWAPPTTVTAAWPATSTTQTVSASSATGVFAGSVVMAQIALRDDSATFTRGATTGIDVASGVTWNGNYVESPATHGNYTGGSDGAYDLGHRFVTSSSSSTVTLRVTATISATETGSVRWVIQRLFTGGFAQARALIQNTVTTKQYAQGQAFIGYRTANANFNNGSASNGWVDSNDAGPWVINAGTASEFSSDGAVGKHTKPTVSISHHILLPQTSIQDVETLVAVKADKLAVGGTQNAFETIRIIDSSNRLQMQWQANTSNQITVSIQKVVGGATSDIVSVTVVPRESAAADTFFWMRAQAEGINPTILRFKVWRDGTTEPGGWDAISSVSDASLQQAGQVGLRTFLGAGTSNTPVVFSFDNFSAGPIVTHTYGYAQARAQIKQTYNGFGQAQAEILAGAALRESFAQAQAQIKQIYQSYAQAQARILRTYNSFAQAQALIKQTYQRYAQAQSRIALPLPRRNSFEGGSNGVDITPANSGGLSGNAFDNSAPNGGTIKYDSTVSAHGSVSSKFDLDGTTNPTQLDWIIGPVDELWIRFYLRVSALPSASTSIGLVETNRGSTEKSLFLWSAGVLRTYDGENGSVSISTNSWVRIEVYFRESTDTQIIRLYLSPESLVPDETIEISSGVDPSNNLINRVSFGDSEGAGQDLNVWMDDIKVSTEGWIGPLVLSSQGQAQARIIQTYTGLAQAQALIKSTVSGLAQAQAQIYTPIGLRPVQDITTNTGIVGVVV